MLLQASSPSSPFTGKTPATGRCNEKSPVTASLSKADADYLEATANADDAVAETNKTNNTRRSAEFGSNKQYTPQ